MSEEEKAAVLRSCETFVSQMSAAGIRCHGDMRDNYTAGWKFNCWELKVSVQSTCSVSLKIQCVLCFIDNMYYEICLCIKYTVLRTCT